MELIRHAIRQTHFSSLPKRRKCIQIAHRNIKQHLYIITVRGAQKARTQYCKQNKRHTLKYIIKTNRKIAAVRNGTFV